MHGTVNQRSDELGSIVLSIRTQTTSENPETLSVPTVVESELLNGLDIDHGQVVDRCVLSGFVGEI